MSRGKCLNIDKEVLGNLCLQGLSIDEIASELSCSWRSICKYLKKFGLKTSYRNTDRFHKTISAQSKARMADPLLRSRISDTCIKKFNTIEMKSRISRYSKECGARLDIKEGRSKAARFLWNSQEYRNKMGATRSTSEFKERFRAATWGSDTYRAKFIETWKNEERLERMNKVWHNPEYIIKASEQVQKRWRDPEFRAKMAVARENMPTTLTRPHLKVCELLTSLGIQYTTEKSIGPYNFDIFIESAGILIEVQGDYWHSRSEQEFRDRAKSTYITQHPKQYRLYYIWEHECLTEGSVLAKLKHWLGLDKVEQVDYELSQITIRPIADTKQADTFLYNWHYQHHGRHGLDLGGYLGDELICLARFTNPSRDEIATSLNHTQKQVLELARLVVHPRYQKKNLCSWFLARCEWYVKKERPEIECLVSFADSTHNHTGIVYKAANWELNRVVGPNYWYVDSGGWIMHKRTLWSHAKSLEVTESEYAEKNGFTKVWGKEKYKFIKKLTNRSK